MSGRRNLLMAERISAAPVRYPFWFVIAGDSGAWPDPTADAIFAQLLKQTARLRPAPPFFANLGDSAVPGTRERHEHYLRPTRMGAECSSRADRASRASAMASCPNLQPEMLGTRTQRISP
jgi:hypothetical protein